jgi:hypothetical protein
MRIDGEQVVGADQQAVAVRRRAGDQFAGDIAAGAGLVFDHDRLAEPGGQRLRHEARDDVGGAPGRECHVEPDRPRGIVFGSGRRRQQRGCDDDKQPREMTHARILLACLQRLFGRRH